MLRKTMLVILLSMLVFAIVEGYSCHPNSGDSRCLAYCGNYRFTYSSKLFSRDSDTVCATKIIGRAVVKFTKPNYPSKIPETVF
ncbi:hypothetical protein DICVIV_09729 [Dictyocaulus viviparus]|uniref:Uncharacterized protein n=1 Tax=Dictyocaulus viviparus TaxID=29172 RepID=A0A0D8XKJ3_DICVI|nr:hypothetical protein DICVIV_09729 [Dictyocaulus viviparus]